MEPTVVLMEEGRVVRMFGERAERLRDTPGPSNDVNLRRPAAPLDDVRTRLDAGMEHAVRDPLLRIATAAGVLRHEVTTAQRHQLDAIAESAVRTDEMLRDMLEFIRSSHGGLPVSRRRIDLKILCERVVDAIHRANPDSPIVFASDRRVDGDWDPDAVESLLSKLLVNAIAYGAQRPPIRVGLRAVSESAVLEVWNAGGIADVGVRARLFEPFVSGAGEVGRGRRGLGLGLYLAREIARAHGGWIDVETDDRTGTTFRATLPRSEG
jgi:signal transduction histidine kinase